MYVVRAGLCGYCSSMSSAWRKFAIDDEKNEIECTLRLAKSVALNRMLYTARF